MTKNYLYLLMLVLIPLAACQNLSNSKASDLIKKSDNRKTISIYTNYMNYSGYKGNVLYYDLEKQYPFGKPHLVS